MAAKRRGPRQRRRQGEGSVYCDRHGQWWAAVEVAGRVTRRRAPSEQAAEAKRAELVAQNARGVPVEQSGQTLEDWLNTWYTIKARALKPKTLAEYKRQIECYILPALGRYPIDKIKADMLQAFFHQTQDEIRGAGRFSGARTVQALAITLRQAFGLAVKRRLILYNPMDGVELQVHKPAKVEPPSEAQIAALLAAACGHPLEPLWHLYALLGLRRGEGLGVRWSDYDPQAMTIRIAQQVQSIEGDGRIVGPPKSDAGARVLPVPAAVCALLDQRKAAQLGLRVRRADRWQDNDLIFPNRDGGHLWPRNVEDDFYEIRGRAGQAMTMHSLRHAVATMLDEAGASEALKADILGHEKATVTQRYTHSRVEAMRRVLEQVAEKVLGRAA